VNAESYYQTNDGDVDTTQFLLGVDELRDFCRRILAGVGYPEQVAALVADSLVDAEARGISSHGVVRTLQGMLDAHAEPEVVSETAAMARVDARNAIGHVGALAGLEAAMSRAENVGVGVAGVFNSNHCGTLAYFVRMATERGLVAIAATNAPVTMAYFGGRTRAVGTNPIAIGVPREGSPPIVLDMATSATARGKIIYAARSGTAIPEGWAVDVDGRPTTEPGAALAGSVLPFAGAKGSGLAMMIDLLTGGLVAGVSGEEIGDMYEDWSRSQRVSHLFFVLDPVRWIGTDAFLAHVAQFADRIQSLPNAEGFDQVRLPGEVEDIAHNHALSHGVVLPGSVYRDLRALAEKVEVDVETAAEQFVAD